uniref:Reverse transcriptase domain-containing protein n=1 Tax=Caenorhabditis japonica TaxID=281687 RepID=A0A8R1DFB7_CAEJA
MMNSCANKCEYLNYRSSNSKAMSTSTLDKSDFPELASLGIVDLDERNEVANEKEEQKIQEMEVEEMCEKKKHEKTYINDSFIEKIAEKLNKLIINQRKNEQKLEGELEQQRKRAAKLTDQLIETTPSTEQIVQAFNSLVDGMVPVIRAIEASNEKLIQKVSSMSEVLEEQKQQLAMQNESIGRLTKTVGDLHVSMAHQSAALHKQKQDELPRKKAKMEGDQTSSAQFNGIRRCYICTGVHQADDCEVFKDGKTRLEEMIKRQRMMRMFEKQNEQHQAAMTALVQAMTSKSNDESRADMTPTTSGVSQTQLMNDIGSRVAMFQFDLETEKTFSKWYARHEAAFTVEGKDLEDKSKVSLLMSKMSDEVYEQYSKRICPRKHTEVEFDETVKTLEQMFDIKKSLFSHRFACINIARDDETPVEYTTKVNSMFTYPVFPIKFQAPKFSLEDIKYLKSVNIDVDSITNTKIYNEKPIDMILGNDFLATAAPNMNKKLLPSKRAIDVTPMGIITYPTPNNDFLISQESILNIEIKDYFKPIFINALQTKSYQSVSDQDLQERVAQLFELEHVGITPPDSNEAKQTKDQYLIQKFKHEAKMLDGKIHVALPYNGKQKELKDNYPIAIKRLTSLAKNLNKCKETRLEYHKIIQSQLESGNIETVNEQKQPTNVPVFYIPHKNVMKDDSLTTKLRIVLDASSHMRENISLNDCLHAGPSILQSILGIMLRARLSNYLLVADIEKAFHQVRVQEEYRDVTRFLWLKNPELGVTPENIVTYRFSRLPFGVSCSPFLLAVTILLYLEINPNEINERIIKNLYVDNVMITTNEEQELHKIYKSTKQIFEKMGMNLREYQMNSQKTRQSIPEVDRASEETVKLLGHLWNCNSDTITIKIPKPPEGVPTKREVVSFLASIYDPMGILSPIIVPIKELTQDLWEEEISWKEKIPNRISQKWETIKATFKQTSYTMPRSLVSVANYNTVQLLLFSDASERHFATAAYLHFKFENSNPITKLIMAKSKVKPKGTELSIPRLELMAIEIAVNAAKTLTQELELKSLSNIKFFSDSMIALYWTGLDMSNQGQCLLGLRALSVLLLASLFLPNMFTELCTVFATVEILCLMYRHFDQLNQESGNDAENLEEDGGIVLHRKYYEAERMSSSPFWKNL